MVSLQHFFETVRCACQTISACCSQNGSVVFQCLGIGVTTLMIAVKTNREEPDMAPSDTSMIKPVAELTIQTTVPHPLVKSVGRDQIATPAGHIAAIPIRSRRGRRI